MGDNKTMSRAHVYEFPEDEDFYRHLHDGLMHTEHTVHLTHMQNRPPRGYNLGNPYFLDLERFAREHPACQIRRLITIPNMAMAAWAEQLIDDLAGIPNFEVRALIKEPDLPFLNMAVLDRRNVFLANSDRERRSSAAMWIYNEQAGAYFANFHDTMWAMSLSLPQALQHYYQTAGNNV